MASGGILWHEREGSIVGGCIPPFIWAPIGTSFAFTKTQQPIEP